MDPVSGLGAVRGVIAQACERAGRDPGTVTLVAVSKTVGTGPIEAVLGAGQRVFGENRVQEAKGKWPPLVGSHPGTELHLIGALQTNKVRDAVGLFDVIHSVDRPGLCEALATQCQRLGRSPRLFVQVNTGAEPQKAGVGPQQADTFLAACRDGYGLAISGLMCVPPAGEPAGPHFSLLRDIAERNGLRCLSMGMSADYAEAIHHGATHVRVGTAIFGARPKP